MPWPLSELGCVAMLSSLRDWCPQVVMSEKSKSVPFLDATAALSGKDLPAGVGFDPLGLSDISFDFRLAAHTAPLRACPDPGHLPAVC